MVTYLGLAILYVCRRNTKAYNLDFILNGRAGMEFNLIESWSEMKAIDGLALDMFGEPLGASIAKLEYGPTIVYMQANYNPRPSSSVEASFFIHSNEVLDDSNQLRWTALTDEGITLSNADDREHHHLMNSDPEQIARHLAVIGNGVGGLLPAFREVPVSAAFFERELATLERVQETADRLRSGQSIAADLQLFWIGNHKK